MRNTNYIIWTISAKHAEDVQMDYYNTALDVITMTNIYAQLYESEFPSKDSLGEIQH